MTEEHIRVIHRHPHIMKPRTPAATVISLLILVLATVLFIVSTRSQGSLQTFPATVNRDCAPWDGSAFTVSIPYNTTSTIMISIWQSPDIRLPIAFSFPDETGQIGFAYVLPELDPLQQLRGKVRFRRVAGESPVEGEFDLFTEAGRKFKGKFEAEWGNQIAMCG
jgi:hypothetical protein